MILRRILWRRISALVLAFLMGCSSVPRGPHVEETGQGKAVVHVPRTADLQLVVVDPEGFQQAMRRLAHEVRLTGTPRQTVEKMFQMDLQFGNYLYLPRDKKLVPAGPSEPWDGTLIQEDLETAERYRLWCQRVHNFYGDCLGGALVAGRYLDMHGRYIWALALSKSPVIDEMKKALGEMVEARALINTVLWTLGSMLLIMALNPVAPALVAVVGLGLILYVGVDTLLNLVNGWLQLMEEVKVGTTFEQIHEAGERFGKILGREAARAFAMLLMAAIGSTAKLFAAKVPTLPGSAQVSVQADGTAKISLSALGKVEEIALTAEGVSVTVAATAMTMGASGRTPRFREIFAKAGMSMEDPANKMPLPGHKGPHPERYHQIVMDELASATATCRSVVDCRERLTRALKALAKDIATPGTELNQLVTRATPR